MRMFFLTSLVLLLGTMAVSAQCLTGDCINGKGEYLFPSGARYVGEFSGGEIHGVGKCVYSDGSIYQGQWVHRFPEGRGKKIFEDGTERLGYWKKGQPVDENGNIEAESITKIVKNATESEVQTGCIKGNCIDGIGLFAYPDGSTYEGQFKDKKPHGHGAFSNVNGEKFIGAFDKGIKHGQGTLFHNDKTTLEGHWDQGEYAGESLVMKGQVGCIQGNCKNGTGTYVYKDGTARYVGQFNNNLPHGNGTVEYANGEKYTGELKFGNFDGYGTLHYRDGRKTTGYWKQGAFLGTQNPKANEELLASLQHPKPVTTKPSNAKPIKNTPSNPSTSTEKPKVYAVIVGVASYNHMPTLRYTDDDAYRMYSFFKSPEGGALPDSQIRILIDEDAHKEKIVNTMKELYAQAGPNDLITLYFSGHGLKGSFIPIDFDGYNNKLSHEEVNEVLAQCQAKYKLVIADACHSGSLLAMKSAEVNNVLENYYNNLAQSQAGTALIMSSKSEETSLESSGLRQGVFSHFLIRGLKGEADFNDDTVISIDELYNFVENNVRQYTGNRQSPVIKGDYDGRMPVGVTSYTRP